MGVKTQWWLINGQTVNENMLGMEINIIYVTTTLPSIYHELFTLNVITVLKFQPLSLCWASCLYLSIPTSLTVWVVMLGKKSLGIKLGWNVNNKQMLS